MCLTTHMSHRDRVDEAGASFHELAKCAFGAVASVGIKQFVVGQHSGWAHLLNSRHSPNRADFLSIIVKRAKGTSRINTTVADWAVFPSKRTYAPTLTSAFRLPLL